MTNAPPISISITDPVNARILAISEDRIEGFVRDPFTEVAQLSGVDVDTVRQRIVAMLEAGTIRRVRQTLVTTSLAPGALIAWKISPRKLDAAFDFMFGEDPFSGHVVIRSTDADTPAAAYRLWTTLKVPQGFSMTAHCDYLKRTVGADEYRIMPARKLFKLGVGHVRRRELEIGAKSNEPVEVTDVAVIELDDLQWRVLTALKREFTTDEIQPDPWRGRAAEAGLSAEEFCRVAQQLNDLGVIGRFSTFLEHVKKLRDGSTVTRYNALFHWAVPPGREFDAGREVGRFHIMTHAYWREAGPTFNNVNVMGVAHGSDKQQLLAHKRAIDEHLAASGIPVSYTNVFWGGRSEIKPSEITPDAYLHWCASRGIDPEAMRA